MELRNKTIKDTRMIYEQHEKFKIEGKLSFKELLVEFSKKLGIN